MAFELTVLGSGCFAPPRPGRGEVRNPSGYAVRVGRETLLFDFGFGNLRQMVRARLDPAQVTHLFVTHLHLDHVGEVPALLFYFRYDAKPPDGKLTIVGPPGFRKWLAGVRRAFAPHTTPRGYKLVVRELAPGATYRDKGWSVKAHAVPHFIDCQAYRFEAGGRALVYSGDTAYFEPLARFARGADTFILECSQPASHPLPEGHLTAAEAVRLAKLAACRRTILSHLSEGAAREAKRLATDGIVVARDLARFKV